MEWTREKTLTLIDEYQKRRGLWDMTHEDYRKKDIKRELLTEVAEKIDTSLPNIEIEKKFHTLRTQYHREIHRMKQNSCVNYKSKWFAFKHLEFLSSPKACRAGKTITEYVKIKTYKSSTSSEKNKSSRYVINDVQSEILEPNANITSEFLTIHKKPSVSQPGKHEIESRKDLEKLIEETTNEDDENIGEVENEEDFKSRLKSFPIHSHFTTSNLNSIEQYFDENKDRLQEANDSQPLHTTIVHDGSEYQTSQQPAIIRIQKRDYNTIEQSSSYEEENQHQPTTKKIYYGGRHSLSIKDEFCSYGEYVANEMRLITSRDILVTLKHKINIALFEANMAQLQK